ncbi:MAG: ATP phosphoribosyltransferase [Gloeomargaritaceae cyanobacterium C42_A2020_066]|nr:ATP phosphoribosyltransferase [Gloeomargaritaceae cyanobacterium C42_A2020_066]
MLVFALPKGALLTPTITLLRHAGLDFSPFLEAGNRQLQILDSTGQAQGLLVRAQDVPVYVAYGQAHVGVVGYDVLAEKQPEVAQLLDLGFGQCRLSVAVSGASPYRRSLDLPAHCRVASKFVHCAQAHFRALNLPVELVPLSGSVELGPITGMAEAIVDLVSTGRTLRDNGLVELEVLFESTARLIAHPLSYRLNTAHLHHWVAKLEALVREITPAPV